MIRVVFWLWRNTGPKRDRVRYTIDHVRRARNMVQRNLSMEHEICLITDDPDAVPEGVRYIPLWDDGLREKGACYVRLKAFAPEMRDIIGPRFVSIDLDCVIVGDLAPLFDRPDPFVIWRNPGVTRHCGSMFMMEAGAFPEVWENFDPDDLRVVHKGDTSHPGGRFAHPRALDAGNVVGSDQAWISTMLPDAPQWTRHDGVLSLKTDLRWSRKPKFKQASTVQLPDHARVVFFHGREDPSQGHVQQTCPWIAEHWR